jgi:hypothetical protein
MMTRYTIDELDAIIAEITSTIFEAQDKGYSDELVAELNHQLRYYRRAMKKAKAGA